MMNQRLNRVQIYKDWLSLLKVWIILHWIWFFEGITVKSMQELFILENYDVLKQSHGHMIILHFSNSRFKIVPQREDAVRYYSTGK